MAHKVITRLRPDGAMDVGMKPMGYISADSVVDGIAEEEGHLFFTNAAGNVNAGVWRCTPCSERIRDYPYDQCCFVLEKSLTITDESGHAQTIQYPTIGASPNVGTFITTNTIPKNHYRPLIPAPSSPVPRDG